MGSAASRIGQPLSKQVVPKAEPINSIANVHYPKFNSSGVPLRMPRSYVRRTFVPSVTQFLGFGLSHGVYTIVKS